MNTPHEHDDDTDPTGMRALLRGLPDPGPMPDDLVRRIQASLAEEPSLQGDETLDHRGSAGVSRGTPGTRPSWWVRHGSKAAIAAVVLIGGGTLATGQLGSLGSGDDASTAASDSAAGAEADSLTKTYSDTDGSTASPGLAEERRDQAVLGTIVVRHTGRTYTAAGLSNELEALANAAATAPLTAETPGIGPIGTEIGVRSCLEAIGFPRATAAEVDLGTLDGTPTAILVVTLEGERTAYAVRRDCSTGNPAVLAGPVTLP